MFLQPWLLMEIRILSLYIHIPLWSQNRSPSSLLLITFIVPRINSYLHFMNTGAFEFVIALLKPTEGGENQPCHTADSSSKRALLG